MRVLDIFAGAGGFSLGFQAAGYSMIGAIEKDKWAADTFKYNHPAANVIVDDIAQISDSVLLSNFNNKIDVLLGGPPCQGFSICNKNAGDPKDPRNSLFTEFLRTANLFKPKILVLENVPNLIKARTKSDARVTQIIEDELQKLDYNVYTSILHATDYGIPQIRKRLFIIGSKRHLKKPFPSATHSLNGNLKKCPTLWDAISDLPLIEAGGGREEMGYSEDPTNAYQKKLRNKSKKVFNHVSMKHSKRMVERFASMSWGDSTHNVPAHLKPRKRNGEGTISKRIYCQNNRRMHPDKPCHTIPASFYANFVHPYRNRNFTAREGARIQSFPDSFRFLGKPTVVSSKLLEREGRYDERYLCQYAQIGNAVPPLMAKEIADNILKQI